MASLDFVIMNGGGSGIQEEVQLLETYHEELMSLFNHGQPDAYGGEPSHPITHFPLLARTRGFYDEAEFSVTELDALEVEVARLQPHASPALAQVLRKLTELIRIAKAQGSPVLALPD